jgi:hypothetical protein
MDEHRYGHASEKERRNREKFCRRARLALDKCGSRKHEASRQLRNENAEQAEVRAAIDVTGDDAQHDRDRPWD